MAVAVGSQAPCWIQSTAAVADYFRFSELPFPEDLNRAPQGQPRQIMRPGLFCKYGGDRFRISTHFIPGKQKPQMWSFRLSTGYRRTTFEVLVRHLDSIDVDWMWLMNRHGNLLDGGIWCSGKYQ